MILELSFKAASLWFFLPSARWQQTCSIDKGCLCRPQRAIKSSRQAANRWISQKCYGSVQAQFESGFKFLSLTRLRISHLKSPSAVTFVDLNGQLNNLINKFANESLASTADYIDTRSIARHTRDYEKS